MDSCVGSICNLAYPGGMSPWSSIVNLSKNFDVVNINFWKAGTLNDLSLMLSVEVAPTRCLPVGSIL